MGDVLARDVLGLWAKYPPTMDQLQAQIQTLRTRLDICNPIIGLDFPTSYDPRPRWGFSQPPNPHLEALFDAPETAGFRAGFMRHLSRMTVRLKAIPREYVPGSGEPGFLNPQQCPLDGAILYSMVSYLKPRLYLEIGSGISTLFVARSKRDWDLETRVESVDPVPRAECDAVCDAIWRKGFESVEMQTFDRLGPGDMVLFDGTHRSFMNSDVTVFFLDLIPRLKPGVVIGIHDVSLPWDYLPASRSFYWNEQYLLASYLLGAGAGRVKVLMPGWQMAARGLFQDSIRPMTDWWGGSPGWDVSGWFFFTKKD